MTTITKEDQIEYIRSVINQKLNLQGLMPTSDTFQQHIQYEIDALNAIFVTLMANGIDEYQLDAMKTANNLNKPDLILNGVLGLNGETGEIADLYKKHKFQGHELSRTKMIEELGDVLWYCACLAEGLETTLSKVALMNINKLKRRYPEGFDPERSKNRSEVGNE